MPQTSESLKTYMIINFRASRISRDAYKLVRIPTIKKIKKRKERIHARGERERELALLLNGILASICISDIIKLSLSATN